MLIERRRHEVSRPWTYSLLDQRQRALAVGVRAGAPGALLLSEVAPVITLGRRTPQSDLAPLPGGVELLRTDRGGLATYHGPGQWVVFVVDRLEALTGDRRGVRRAVNGLLDVALCVGRELGAVDVRVGEGAETGVWSAAGKFAAVGVHIENGVLLHGLAVNGFRTPTSFAGIRPCGLDAPVDFLLPAPDDAAFEALGDRLVSACRDRFWL